MDEKELQKLYDAVSGEYNVGDWNTFRSKMQTGESRKKFYDAISSEGFSLGDYNQYEKRLGGNSTNTGLTSFLQSTRSVPKEPTYKIPSPQEYEESLPSYAKGNQAVSTATNQVVRPYEDITDRSTEINERNEAVKGEAIQRTAQRSKRTQEAVKKDISEGKLILSTDNKGNKVYGRPQGLAEAFVRGITGNVGSGADAIKIKTSQLSGNPDDLKNTFEEISNREDKDFDLSALPMGAYTDNLELEQTGTPIAKPSGFSQEAASFAGEIAPDIALASATGGLGNAAKMTAIGGKMYTSSYAHKAQELYQKGKQEAMAQGMDEEQASHLAAQAAAENAEVAAIPDAALNTLFFSGKLHSPAANNFIDVMKGSVKNIAKVGGLGAGASAAASGIEGAQGYNTDHWLDKAIEAGGEFGKMEALFNVLPVMKSFPKAAQSAIKEFAVDPVVKPFVENYIKTLPEAKQVDVMKDLAEYEDATKDIRGIVPQEKMASLGGRIQKRINRINGINIIKEDIKELEAKKTNLPEVLHKDIDATIKEKKGQIESLEKEIDVVDNEIGKINNSEGSGLEHEVDELTGEKILSKKSLEKSTQGILNNVKNAEWVNENDIKGAEDELYGLLDKNPDAAHLIEPLILKLQDYEFTTKTENRTVTENQPTGTTNKTKRDVRPALEQSEGSRVTVTGDKGTVSGVLRIENGKYVISNENGDKVGVIGEKAINDRDLILPDNDENPIHFDENGKVKSVTFQTKDGKLITIEHPEKALDIAIQLQADTLGEVPNEAFNEIYKEVEKNIKVEVPKYPEKLGADANKISEVKNETEILDTETKGSEQKEMVSETSQPTADQKSEGDSKPPKKPAVVPAPEDGSIEFKKKEFERARNKIGIDLFQDERTTTKDKSQAKAIESINEWKKEGTYDDNIADIQKRAKSGHINNEEQFIFAKHLADLDETVNSIKDIKSPEYDEALKQYSNALEAADSARSEFGRQLGMIAINKGEPLTLADWMAERKQSLGVDELPEKVKEETAKDFSDYEEKLKAAEEKQKQSDEEIAALKAELALKTEAEKRKTIRKKNREQLKTERDDIINSIREKLGKSSKDLSATFVPYADKLIEIAPDVAKLVTNLVDTGVSKLSDVVDNIHEILKDQIEGITKKDVNDVIAGVYNKPKPELSDLQQRIKELKAESKKESGDYQMQQMQKRIDTEIKDIEERIKNKDYETKKRVPFDENALLRKANPKLWKETMDALIAKNESKDKLELAKRRDELAKLHWFRKGLNTGGKVLTTAKAIKAGIDDSITMVQLLMAVLANPRAGFKAKIEALQDAASNQRFKRNLAALHNDKEFWNIIQGSKLDITEPKSITKENVEELYSGNLLDTKIGGKVNLWTNTGGIFERAFTSMGNNMRLNLFKERVADLMNENKTFESHPEEYKSAARVINELTARGKVAESLQGAMKVISPIIWAPKMMASSFNILGVGDLANAAAGNKGYYASLTPKQRIFAVKQLGRGIGVGVSIMGALAMNGWTVDYNPQSSGFGTVTSPDGNRRYNVFGRFSSTARTIIQLITGVRKTTEGKEQDIDAQEGGRGGVLWKYIRGKMTPFAGEAGDYVLNRKRNTFTKKKIGLSTLPEDLLMPMSIAELKQGFKNDGTESLLNRFLPALEGIQVQDKRDFIDDLPTLIERNADPNTQDIKKLKNYKKGGKDITKDEFENYNKVRNKKITADVTKLFNDGFPVIRDGKVQTIPYKELTNEEKADITTEIKRKATLATKEELFGKKKETSTEKRAKDKLETIKDKWYK